MSTEDKLYSLQQQHMDQDAAKDGRAAVHETWFHDTTVDFWRHKRMYDAARPLAQHYREKRWLTVGDGRYGLDSHRLAKLFGIAAFPTDISENMLREGKKRGLFPEYSVENAEHLSFSDNSYDVVFCKDSFHHFPRPIVALYEMLRVATTAVILIEPNDVLGFAAPRVFLSRLAKRVLGALTKSELVSVPPRWYWNGPGQSFEESGNYVYSVSRRELEKIVMALNLGGLAWLGFNDYYVQGVEFEPAQPQNPVFQNITKVVERMNRRCRWLPLFYGHNYASTVLFKTEVTVALRTNMEHYGYEFSPLAKNPHA